MNLRCDNTFVQDEGWYQAYNRYEDFLRRHENCKVLYLELGVGGNTPALLNIHFGNIQVKIKMQSMLVLIMRIYLVLLKSIKDHFLLKEILIKSLIIY